MKMMKSKLIPIIKRLQAMTLAKDAHEQRREFTAYGVYVCEVIYRQSENEFIIVRNREQEQLVFDDLDLAAIEIFNCLYDFYESF